MTNRYKLIFLIPVFTAVFITLQAQVVDSVSFTLYTRQNFYSGEEKADFFLEIPASLRYINLIRRGLSAESLERNSRQ